MNILFLTLLYPNDQIEKVRENVSDKIQNQINVYQHACIEGIKQNLHSDETLSIINSLPVGIFPNQYRKLFLDGGLHDGNTIRNLFSINLPGLKQWVRQLLCCRAIRNWAKEDPNNRTVLLYTQYLPYLKAIRSVKRSFPDLNAVPIITDLPNEYGLSTGRKGILLRAEKLIGNRSLRLCKHMDGFVLLTRYMSEIIPVDTKPYLVMEGLCVNPPPVSPGTTIPVQSEGHVMLYTGTLEPDLGIKPMLEAFADLPKYTLWVCGSGSMEKVVSDYASSFGNIHYFGSVPHETVLELQQQATVLINPRPSSGLFTRYSFPSKTIEYLRSGKPVLCAHLDGIPNDYDPFLVYLKGSDANAIKESVTELFSLSEDELEKLGANGRDFVLSQKNETKQGGKLVSYLRTLSHATK